MNSGLMHLPITQPYNMELCCAQTKFVKFCNLVLALGTISSYIYFLMAACFFISKMNSGADTSTKHPTMELCCAKTKFVKFCNFLGTISIYIYFWLAACSFISQMIWVIVIQIALLALEVSCVIPPYTPAQNGIGNQDNCILCRSI